MMRTTIRAKLLMGFLVLTALLGVGYSVTGYGLGRIKQANARIRQQWVEVSLISQAQLKFDESVGILTGFIISEDETERARLLQSIQATLHAIEQAEQLQIAKAESSFDKASDRQEAIKFINLVKENLARIEFVLGELSRAPLASAGREKFFNEAPELSRKTGDNLNELREVADRDLNHCIRMVRKEEKLSDRISSLTVIGMTLSGLAFSLIFSRSITRRVANVTTHALQIGQGNFDYPLVAPSRDEIGELEGVLQHMAVKLKGYYENLERMIEEKSAELRQAQNLAAIGQAVSVVAHEVRSPLQSIYMSVDTLRNGMRDDKDKLEILEEIEYSVNLLNGIVQELLDYSRPIRMDYSQAQTRKTIRQALNALEDKLQNIAVHLELEDGDREIWMDAGKMTRVFLNLISNAVEAMPRGGNLMISSMFSNCNGDNVLMLSISDDGEGIAQENMERIYEPFFTTKPQGTGLGIPICKKIIDAHRGTFYIRSIAGQGTTVEITLFVECPAVESSSLNASPKKPTIVSLNSGTR